LQGDRVGVATALSPATVGHFKFLFHLLFVGLGLTTESRLPICSVGTSAFIVCQLNSSGSLPQLRKKARFLDLVDVAVVIVRAYRCASRQLGIDNIELG
jgi:hypothetical protein